jgi:hypothetical protein
MSKKPPREKAEVEELLRQLDKNFSMSFPGYCLNTIVSCVLFEELQRRQKEYVRGILDAHTTSDLITATAIITEKERAATTKPKSKK